MTIDADESSIPGLPITPAYPTAQVRILLTAFGAFPGARINPTPAIAARVAASRRLARFGLSVVAHSLPVLYDGAAQRVAALIRKTSPDAILHLGLAARRRWLSVETRAANRQSPLRVDAARRLPGSIAIKSGAPGILRARWPAPRVAAAMRATGAPTRCSIDAGDYLCNQTLYLTLSGSDALAGFVHVPAPRRRARQSGADPRSALTIPAMARAVEAAVLLLAAEARRRARANPHAGRRS